MYLVEIYWMKQEWRWLDLYLRSCRNFNFRWRSFKIAIILSPCQANSFQIYRHYSLWWTPSVLLISSWYLKNFWHYSDIHFTVGSLLRKSFVSCGGTTLCVNPSMVALSFTQLDATCQDFFGIKLRDLTASSKLNPFSFLHLSKHDVFYRHQLRLV